MTVQRQDTHVDYATGQVTTTLTTTTTARIAPRQCKYFIAGKCKFGAECFYSHDLMTETVPMTHEMPMTTKFETVQPTTELEQSYLENTRQIIHAVVEDNSNVKELVGNMIYPYV